MHRLRTAIATTLFAKGTGAALDFGVLLATAHVLGPAGRGVVATAMAWTGLVVAVFGLSLGQVCAHRYIHDKGRFPQTVSALALLSVALSLAAWLCALLFHELFQTSIGGLVFVIAMAMAPLAIWDTYLSHLLSVSGGLQRYNLLQVSARGLGFSVAMTGLFVLEAGVFAPLAGSLLAFAIIASLGLREVLRNTGGLRVPGRGALANLATDGARLHINTVGSFLLFHGAVLLLGELRPLAEVGWYQAAMQIVSVPLLLPGVVTSALFAHMGSEGLARAWVTQRRVVAECLAGLALIAIIGIVFAEPIIDLLLGPEFQPAAPALRILLLAMMGMGFSQVMVAQWIGHGYFLQSGLLTLALGMAGFTLNWALIPRHGYMASAWITAALFGIVSLVNVGFIRHIERRAASATSPPNEGLIP